MAGQSFQSHTHQPTLTYVATAFWLAALVLLFLQGASTWTVAAMLGAVAALVWISRSYIVALQDRIILLEMKVRAAEVLPPGQDALLARLHKKQIVALRFASDEELGALLERAVRENLSPRDIKASIRTWRPDPYRT